MKKALKILLTIICIIVSIFTINNYLDKTKSWLYFIINMVNQLFLKTIIQNY